MTNKPFNDDIRREIQKVEDKRRARLLRFIDLKPEELDHRVEDQQRKLDEAKDEAS